MSVGETQYPDTGTILTTQHDAFNFIRTTCAQVQENLMMNSFPQNETVQYYRQIQDQTHPRFPPGIVCPKIDTNFSFHYCGLCFDVEKTA